MENLHRKKKSLGCRTKICKEHGEYLANVYQIHGRKRESLCPECLKEKQKEMDLITKQKDKAVRLKLIRYSGIPKRFIASTFENYNQTVSDNAKSNFKKIKSYSDGFKKVSSAGSSLILCGRPGTGKTHLACALCVNLISRKYRVTYTTSYKIMAKIKETYNKNSIDHEHNIIEKFTSTDLLIIDEIGMQFGSESEKVLFFQILNGRYENILPTVLISNLTINELSRFIGERCFDRLKEGSGAVLSFDWDTYRK